MRNKISRDAKKMNKEKVLKGIDVILAAAKKSEAEYAKKITHMIEVEHKAQLNKLYESVVKSLNAQHSNLPALITQLNQLHRECQDISDGLSGKIDTHMEATEKMKEGHKATVEQLVADDTKHYEEISKALSVVKVTRSRKTDETLVPSESESGSE